MSNTFSLFTWPDSQVIQVLQGSTTFCHLKEKIQRLPGQKFLQIRCHSCHESTAQQSTNVNYCIINHRHNWRRRQTSLTSRMKLKM